MVWVNIKEALRGVLMYPPREIRGVKLALEEETSLS